MIIIKMPANNYNKKLLIIRLFLKVYNIMQKW